ncbi:ABC transporter E family member 2-like protein [Tanacetum coccineum]
MTTPLHISVNPPVHSGHAGLPSSYVYLRAFDHARQHCGARFWILTNSNGSVRSWLKKKIPDIHDSQFVSDVIKPLGIEELMDQKVQNLSGGELQRVELCICLGKPFVNLLMKNLISPFMQLLREMRDDFEKAKAATRLENGKKQKITGRLDWVYWEKRVSSVG